ncbi:ORF3 [Neotofec virus RodL2_5]|uniref:ORF3 n=1 Tax=Neotofec virus RodL2_5 TaxID=2929218 RepID=A0A976N1I1_9VIRU|nr:ORF3 [Neotofec virus RodL2_5]
MGLSAWGRSIRKKKTQAKILQERRLAADGRQHFRGGAKLRRDSTGLQLGDRSEEGETSPKAKSPQTSGAPQRTWSEQDWINIPFWEREIQFNLRYRDSETDFTDAWGDSIEEGAPSTDSGSSLEWPLSPIHRPLDVVNGFGM